MTLCRGHPVGGASARHRNSRHDALGFVPEPPFLQRVESLLADDDYEDDASGDAEPVADIEEFMTSLLRRLRRSRSALVCLGFLGLLSGAASITLLVVVLQRAVGSSPSPTWYSYADLVAQTLAVAVPALACVVVATRALDAGFRPAQG